MIAEWHNVGCVFVEQISTFQVNSIIQNSLSLQKVHDYADE